MLLASTSDIVRVVTDAAADVEVHASWVDIASGTTAYDRTNTASITTATTTTVVSSPGASTQRKVKHLNVRNNHASQSVTVTVEHTDGTNAVVVAEAALLAGEHLVYDQLGEWTHYDQWGGRYPLSTVMATRADMEAATSTSRAVSPSLMRYHPGACKAWAKGGVTGNLLASYNMTSLTDTGAGLATFNFDVDFANDVSYALVVNVERTVTTLGESDIKYANVRLGLMTAGSCQVEVYDGTNTTAVQEDPTSYHVAAFGSLV